MIPFSAAITSLVVEEGRLRDIDEICKIVALDHRPWTWYLSISAIVLHPATLVPLRKIYFSLEQSCSIMSARERIATCIEHDLGAAQSSTLHKT